MKKFEELVYYTPIIKFNTKKSIAIKNILKKNLLNFFNNVNDFSFNL